MSVTQTPQGTAVVDAGAGAPVATAGTVGAPIQLGLAAIELIGVSKHFSSREGNVQAVERIDLAIGQGEFFSLLGPSGCGKTTTLRMIAGFEEPTQGRILLYGEDMVGVPPNRRDVNLVFQSYALFPHLNVFENVAFGLRRRKVPSEAVRRRVQEVLELVQLEGRERRRPKELSGGQQQRVALARALVNNPRALLLDEPLGALDLKLRQAMQIELKRIQREVGITFVYVTHDQGEALTMSDRLVVMNEGRIEQLGSPREVYEQPRTRFVAGFIGTSNLLSGRVGRVVNGSALLDMGPGERVVVPLRGDVAPGHHLDLTVRPEKIDMTNGPEPPDAECRIKGRITDVVYLGSSTQHVVVTSTGASIVVFSQNRGVSADTSASTDEVWLSWRAEHSYLLVEQEQTGEDHLREEIGGAR
jgi:spermidine/putrescine transport system ATP-binding protein